MHYNVIYVTEYCNYVSLLSLKHQIQKVMKTSEFCVEQLF